MLRLAIRHEGLTWRRTELANMDQSVDISRVVPGVDSTKADVGTSVNHALQKFRVVQWRREGMGPD